MISLRGWLRLKRQSTTKQEKLKSTDVRSSDDDKEQKKRMFRKLDQNFSKILGCEKLCTDDKKEVEMGREGGGLLVKALATSRFIRAFAGHNKVKKDYTSLSVCKRQLVLVYSPSSD